MPTIYISVTMESNNKLQSKVCCKMLHLQVLIWYTILIMYHPTSLFTFRFGLYVMPKHGSLLIMKLYTFKSVGFFKVY